MVKKNHITLKQMLFIKMLN